MTSNVFTGLMLGLFASTAASAANIDGLLDASYGAATAHVSFDVSAPNSNFQAPTNLTDHASYDIYMTSDANYWYGLFKADTDAGIVGTFANLYFDIDPAANNGSDIGFELSGDHTNFFVPGVNGTFAVNDILTASADNGRSFEVAIPIAYFVTHLPDFPYYSDQTWPGGSAVLRLSQTFGYSVAGGASYGANRLGAFATPLAAVPEPATWGAMLLGFGLIGGVLRRRTRATLTA